MNTTQVKKWLEEMQPIEIELKNWYDLHQTPMPKEIYLNRLEHFSDLALHSDPAFHALDSEQLNLGSLLDKKQDILTDSVCFSQNENMTIRKHPRYLPELIHSTDFVEIIYVFKGSCIQHFYYKDQVESVTLRQGDICVIQPYFQNTKAVYDDSIIINIMVRKKAFQNSISNLVTDKLLLGCFYYLLYQTDIKNYLIFSSGKDLYIQSSILDMMVESCESRSYNQKVLFLILGLIFAHLQRDYMDTLNFSTHYTSRYNYIPRFMMYIRENHATFKLKDMSEHFHLNASYISRIFKETTHTTITETLMQIRLEKAQMLLETTNLSVSDICISIGYSDVTHFIRVFKRTTGLTPLQYRKTHSIIN